MFNNYNLSSVQDYLPGNFSNYSINVDKYDVAILAIHTVKFSLAVSNLFHLVRSGHFMNSPYQYTFFTGMSISDDIFSIYRQLSKISFGIYDDIVTAASVSATTASSMALAYTAKDQIEGTLTEVRVHLKREQDSLDRTLKLESNPNARLLGDGNKGEMTEIDREMKRKFVETQKSRAENEIQQHTENEGKLVNDQHKIGSQDYATFLLANGRTLAQMQEIIEKEGFNFELLKPKIIAVSVNAFMCFGYNIYIQPKLPAAIIGNEQTAATIKIGIQTGASIAITSAVTFSGNIYDLAYDKLLNKDENKTTKEEAPTPDKEASKEMTPDTHEDNSQHGAGEL